MSVAAARRQSQCGWLTWRMTPPDGMFATILAGEVAASQPKGTADKLLAKALAPLQRSFRFFGQRRCWLAVGKLFQQFSRFRVADVFEQFQRPPVGEADARERLSVEPFH